MRENTMVIVSAQSRMSLGCCMYGFDAELKVDRCIDGKYQRFYVFKHNYSETIYGVSKSSIFDDDTWDMEYLEEYDNLEDAKKSDFGQCFEIVDRMTDELGTMKQAG